MKQLSEEKKGEILILGELLMTSLLPIIISYSTKIMPPILFAGLSTMTASITTFLYLLFKKDLKSIFNKSTLKNSIGIALFIIIFPSILIFTGSSKTSGINTTILLQSEILFTFVIYGLFSIEKITLKRTIGALIVMLGTSFIVYNGTKEINYGDLLIIAGTAIYPLGNIFSKKALKTGSPSTILFIRNFLGGISLITLSLIFENQYLSFGEIANYWPLVAINGIFIYHLSKIFWYESIKRIDVSKAITISIGGSPALSLILAMLFLKEIPTIFQLAGFIAIIIGMFILTRKSENLESAQME